MEDGDQTPIVYTTYKKTRFQADTVIGISSC